MAIIVACRARASTIAFDNRADSAGSGAPKSKCLSSLISSYPNSSSQPFIAERAAPYAITPPGLTTSNGYGCPAAGPSVVSRYSRVARSAMSSGLPGPSGPAKSSERRSTPSG
jgi:hypothetical protein